CRVTYPPAESDTLSTRSYESTERSHSLHPSLEVCMNPLALMCAAAGMVLGCLTDAYAEQPPPPCHPNPNAAADRDAVASRGDVVKVPQRLNDGLVRLAARPA